MESSPGPWTIRKSGTGRTAIVAADNLEVAFIFRNQRYGAGNASLISAAPDLVEALESILPGLDDPKLVDTVVQAIAKSRQQHTS